MVRIERSSLDEKYGFQLGTVPGLSIIAKIHKGGLASRQSDLKRDDILISVNETSALDLSRQEVLDIMRSAFVLNLTVARGEHLPAMRIQALLRGVLQRKRVRRKVQAVLRLTS